MLSDRQNHWSRSSDCVLDCSLIDRKKRGMWENSEVLRVQLDLV